MAEINLFHYSPGTSPLHRLAPQLRVLVLIVYIAAVLARPFVSLMIFPVVLLMASISAGLKWKDYRRELRLFGVLGTIIFLSGAMGFFHQGPAAALLHGGVPAGAFLMVVWLGILFTALTDPDELYSVIRWLLGPIPGIPAGRIAARTGMTLVLIPLLLDTVHEIREARKARGIELRRNPMLWMGSLVNPLMENLLLHMEEFSMALEARCFDENVVRRQIRPDTGQIPMAVLYLLPAILAILLPLLLPVLLPLLLQ